LDLPTLSSGGRDSLAQEQSGDVGTYQRKASRMSEAVAARTPRTRGQLDKQRALEQAERGLTPQEIADSQGVHRTTVWRFLEASKPELQALHDFKTNRADVFAKLQAQAIDLQFKIIASFEKDGVLDALTPSQKSGLLGSLNAVAGTIYDKERLERGQSTENVSLLTKVLGSAQDKVFRNQRVTEK